MKTVVIVGVGALGSHAAQFLRSTPDIRLRFVDFDRVEAQNTQAQFHAFNMIGKNKALVLQQALQFLWRSRPEAFPTKLTEDNASVLLRGADLVLDCTDNIEARRVISAFAAKPPITPCLHGALAADGQFALVAWDANFRADAETSAGAPTCEDGQHLTFIALAAALLAHAAALFLTTGQRVGFSASPVSVTRTV